MPTDEPLTGTIDTGGPPPGFSDLTAQTVSLDESDRHRLLASARRRAVLAVVNSISLPLHLRQLATAVAAYETHTQQPDDAVRRIAVSLHHVHLPLMDDLDVLKYDTETNRISG